MVDTALMIEADDAPYSDYETDKSLSSTGSLSSSIQEHVYANGRRYHRKSQDTYLLPSDETEQDRLDMTHHLELLVLGGDLHTADFGGSDPANVLDCGTGTGIWALDFGELHPGSKVIGVDLAPIQPTWTLPNVSFETDDLEKPWTYKPDQFDFIHSRMIGISIKDWGRYTQQMFYHTRPGGQVEIAEHSLDTSCDDDSIPEGSPITRYITTLREGFKRVGVPVEQVEAGFITRNLEEAGFVDVKVKTYRVPWGCWPKDKALKYMGAVQAEIMTTGAEAYGMQVFTRVLGIPEEEARKMVKEEVEAVKKAKEHRYHFVWQIVGRKPKVGE